METIDSLQVRNRIAQHWPAAYPRIADNTYLLPTSTWFIENVLQATTIEGWVYVPEAFDCDNYSAILRSWCIQGVKRFGWKYQLPIAEADGHFTHVKENHSLNIVCTMEGIKIVEPQNDSLRDPMPGDDVFRYWM